MPGLSIYYDFAANIGDFELVDPIKGTDNSSPSLFVNGGRMILSASNFGGGTANLSASLDEGKVYTLEFDANRLSLSGIDFRIYKPDGTYYDDSEVVGYVDTLVGHKSYKMLFSGSAAVGANDTHKIQFTFFDNNGADGSDGSLDDFYVYSKIEPNVVVLDQFNINGSTPTTYVLNEKILNTGSKSAQLVRV